MGGVTSEACWWEEKVANGGGISVFGFADDSRGVI